MTDNYLYNHLKTKTLQPPTLNPLLPRATAFDNPNSCAIFNQKAISRQRSAVSNELLPQRPQSLQNPNSKSTIRNPKSFSIPSMPSPAPKSAIVNPKSAI